MARCFSKPYLRRLRNEIPIAEFIVNVLKMTTRLSDGRRCFLCPLCGDFNTATNPKTNLARCFYCERNFNPIDLTMIVKHYAFIDAVDFLDRCLEFYQSRAVVGKKQADAGEGTQSIAPY